MLAIFVVGELQEDEKMRPSTGVLYSLALRSLLARSLSAAAQRSRSSRLSWSRVMGGNGREPGQRTAFEQCADDRSWPVA